MFVHNWEREQMCVNHKTFQISSENLYQGKILLRLSWREQSPSRKLHKIHGKIVKKRRPGFRNGGLSVPLETPWKSATKQKSFGRADVYPFFGWKFWNLKPLDELLKTEQKFLLPRISTPIVVRNLLRSMKHSILVSPPSKYTLSRFRKNDHLFSGSSNILTITSFGFEAITWCTTDPNSRLWYFAYLHIDRKQWRAEKFF